MKEKVLGYVKVISIVVSTIVFVSCIGQLSKEKDNSDMIEVKQEKLSENYQPPQIPMLLKTADERIDFIAAHYWDNFDFCDSTVVENKVYVEQAWSNYIAVITKIDYNSASISLKDVMQRASSDSLVLDRFIEVSEKYLYNPNSPMRNEELFIPVLEYIIGSDKVDELMKLRPVEMLKMAKKNMVGSVASDFDYTLSNGVKHSMHSILADNILIFFNNPDCEDCKRVKAYIENSPTFISLVSQMGETSKKAEKLVVLSVYPDEDIDLWRKSDYPSFFINSYDAGCRISSEQLYDLKAIPTLYLLDSQKRVILKDATIEMVEKWLKVKNN